MRLIDVLHLIDKHEAPKATYMRKSDLGGDIRADLHSDISDMVTLCFDSDDDTWIESPINHPVLIPWYDCNVYAIEGYEKGIKAWLDYDQYTEDMLSDWWERHTDYETN